MHLPKIGLKRGIYASAICIIIAYIIWPLLYDFFGEGAELTRDTVRQSKYIHHKCQVVKRFLIVPWGLVFDDSDHSGQLKISYWFICNGAIASVNATYHHLGQGWIADSVKVNLASQRHELIADDGRDKD
jgi:hypothetical protein